MQNESESAPLKAAAETHTPAQWSDAVFPANKRGHRPFNYWKHRAADVMHGWSRHEYAEGLPMQLSAADYEAAIKAVGSKKPHPAALSRHKPERQRLKRKES